MRSWCISLIAASCLFAPSVASWAHGDIHERIAACTRKIQEQPGNPGLHLQRADLYRQHGERDRALADCARAEKLDPELVAVDFVRGQTLVDAGELQPAKQAFDRLLAAQPRHSQARIARARLFAKLKLYAAAEQDWTAALAHVEDPEPDHFLERAQMQAAQEKWDAAVAGLDEGVRKLGPIVSLESAAIDLELRQGRFDSALARVDRLAAQSVRKESWLARRGDVLERAGKPEAARAAYQSALDALQSSPSDRRRTKSLHDLETGIVAAIERLKKVPR